MQTHTPGGVLRQIHPAFCVRFVRRRACYECTTRVRSEGTTQPRHTRALMLRDLLGHGSGGAAMRQRTRQRKRGRGKQGGSTEHYAGRECARAAGCEQQFNCRAVCADEQQQQSSNRRRCRRRQRRKAAAAALARFSGRVAGRLQHGRCARQRNTQRIGSHCARLH